MRSWGGRDFLAAPSFGPETQGLVFGEDDQALGEQPEAPGEFAHGDFHPAPGLPGGGGHELAPPGSLRRAAGPGVRPDAGSGRPGRRESRRWRHSSRRCARAGTSRPASAPARASSWARLIVFLHLEGDIPVLVRVAPGQQGAEDLGETRRAAPPRGSGPASPGVRRPRLPPACAAPASGSGGPIPPPRYPAAENPTGSGAGRKTPPDAVQCGGTAGPRERGPRIAGPGGGCAGPGRAL